jgi:hypothetical protein
MNNNNPSFRDFVALFADDSPDNQCAIITRGGGILIQHRWGAYNFDTIDDFLRAYAPQPLADGQPAASPSPSGRGVRGEGQTGNGDAVATPPEQPLQPS